MNADLLVVVAHPDDETLHCGALIAQAARRGEHVVTVTLTRGGKGRTLGMCTSADLPRLREKELRSAAEVLGITHAVVHDLPDGQLAETEEEGVRLVRGALLQWQPTAVVGFPPNGLNGHPDHCAAHRITVTALAEPLTGSAAPDLWLMTSGTAYAEPPRDGYLPPSEVERTRMSATLHVAVGDSLETKLRAMGCYESQARSTAKILRCYPEKLLTEAFHQVR